MPRPRKLHDTYFKQAKAEGYAARSAYKLLEIQDKRRMLRRGDRVLDLGCAPGSWLQVTQELVGPTGLVLGIDLTAVTIPLLENVRTIVGDAFTADPQSLTAMAGGFFDVVLSDMAPNTTGHGDDFLSARLCERVLDVLPKTLRPGGTLLMKILEGEPTPDVIRRTKGLFREAGTTKPAASRDLSREIFIWGVGYEPARQQPAAARSSGAPIVPAGWSVPDKGRR